MSGRDGHGTEGTLKGTRGRAQLPLLDRLTDDDPDQAIDRPLSATASLAILRSSVRADLEALLNARRRWRSWNPQLRELETSPAAFGLPDFAVGAFNDPARREELRRNVEDCIARFEPRFAHVRVVLVPNEDRLASSLRLRIEALLRAEPAPEPIAFNTRVDTNTTNVTVLVEES